MKFIAIVSIALGLSLASCTSEAKQAAGNAAGNAASALGDAASKMLDTVKAQVPSSLNGLKDALAKITNVEQAKSALASLTPAIETASKAFGGINLGELAKKFSGNLPTEITGAVDGVTKEVTRLNGNADIKGVLGSALDKITEMLKK